MASTVGERGPIAASPDERPALNEIKRLLSMPRCEDAKLAGPEGKQIALPKSVFQVLRQVVHAMAQDQAVSVVPMHEVLTTQRAADLLGVSRPHLVQMLDAGEIRGGARGWTV